MKIIFLKRLGLILPIVAVICGLALQLADPMPLQVLRNSLFDQYQRWHPRDYSAVPVRIIDIDDDSLNKLGQWPWPRTRIAELVEKLNAAGAAAIGFDVMFAEADRTSPQAMAAEWSLKGPLRQALEALPDHDQVLANSLNGANTVLGFALQREASSGKTHLPAHRSHYIYSGEPPRRWLHAFGHAVTSLPALEQAAQGNGALSFVPDSDGVVRRVPLVLRLAGDPVPTLTAEMLRVAQGEQNYFLKTEGTDIGLAEIRIGQLQIPTTAQGEIWVHYTGKSPNRYLPAWKLFAGQIPPAQIEGQLILIGSSAQGLMDLRFSPRGHIIPGVEVHAQALEQILSGHILQRPAWALAVESIALLTGGLMIGYLAVNVSSLLAAGATLLLLCGISGGGWYAFREHALLLNTVTPALIFAVIFVLGSLLHHLISEREQRWIKQAFSRYVSPNRVSHLVEHPDDIALGGHRQECSFIFTDLAGFTTLMESLDPAEAVGLLNAYLDRMIGIAFRFEGTLDRIVGDAVAIMFSAPVQQDDHRARALACALEMDAFATAYANELNAKGIRFGHTRIGIHSGEVIVGNFGGSTMFDYRALGDAVNTASRLEGVNKYLGTHICLSDAILAGCSDARVRPIGRLVLKGKNQALQVFEPLTAASADKYAPLDLYQDAWRMMADEAPDAAEIFHDLAARYPNDPLLALHSRRLAEGARGDLIVMHDK